MCNKKPVKMGRTELVIDWPQIDELCKIQCTASEISTVIGISCDTLLRRCKKKFDCTFAEYIAQKRVLGFESLRRQQYEVASKGNVTMLIWLGKQWLGQKDKQEISSGERGLSADELSNEALVKIVKDSKKDK